MWQDINPDVIKDLKERIDISDYVSQYVDLKYENNQWVGLCPFHKEKTPSFKISKDNKHFCCYGCHTSGDIIDFAQEFHKIGYSEAVCSVASFINYQINPNKTSDTIKLFKKYKPIKRKSEYVHKLLDISEYKKFPKTSIPLWEEEGISAETIDKYDIRFDKSNNRILYPVYDYNGKLINIKGRTIHEYWKELKIPKYLNYYKVGCLDYLQELNKAKDYVREQKEIIIFEGIKSCMKAYQFGVRNQVSAETSILNYEQVKLILSLGCDVVIAFDKDKKLNDFYNKDLSLLTKFTNVYYINDKYDLLGKAEDKNSPVDKGEEIWKELYTNRERVMI